MMSSVKTNQPLSRTVNSSLRRHSDLYFSSGDIILTTTGGTDKTVLCLHKTVLSLHSPIFQDMVAMPAQPDTNETYDGLPMVQLHDDAGDLEAFVKFLYNFGCVTLGISAAHSLTLLQNTAEEAGSRHTLASSRHLEVSCEISGRLYPDTHSSATRG